MYIQSIEKNKVDVKNNLRKIKKLTLLFLYEKKGKEKMLENYKEKKSLVIYFSRADENYAVGYIAKGNTEVIAKYIKDLTSADLFKVEPKIPYAKDYNTCIEEAKERKKNHDAPILVPVPDISTYEVIYIGTPVYWGLMPEEMVTALKDLDFTGKIIRPFTTHEGSGLGNIPEQLRKLCHDAILTEGLAVQGSSVYQAENEVQKWL